MSSTKSKQPDAQNDPDPSKVEATSQTNFADVLSELALSSFRQVWSKPTLSRSIVAAGIIIAAGLASKPLPTIPDWVWPATPSPVMAKGIDTFDSTMYLFTYDPSKDGDVKTRKFDIHLNTNGTYSGTYENLGNHHKGPVTGYPRHGTVVLTYAVDNVDSPGLATVFLRPIRSERMPEPIYVGQQLGPDCSCDGLTEDDAPMSTVAAILMKQQTLPEPIRKAVFDGKPPQMSTFRTPKEVYNILNPSAEVTPSNKVN